MVRLSRGERLRIRFYLDQDGPVRIRAYDLTGRLAAEILNEVQSAGPHLLLWDGAGAGSGTYLLVFEAAGRRARGKIVLIR